MNPTLVLIVFIFFLECAHSDRSERAECSLDSKSFPFVVFIPVFSRSPNPTANLRCAGVLLNEKFVLTSSNCLQFAMKTVELGRYDTSKNESEMLEVEIESWTKYEHEDIALLKLANNVKYTKYIMPVYFPFQPPKEPLMCTSGWGLTSPMGPVSTIKKVVTHSLVTCKRSLPNVVCLSPKNRTNLACNGDEGSPILYCENKVWVLYGVLTSVFDSNNMPCAVSSPAEGVLLTGKTLNWIKNRINN